MLGEGIPYPCRVVDKRGSKLELHFKNWNARYDLWLDEDSPRIVDCPSEVVADGSQVSRTRETLMMILIFFHPDDGCPLGYNLRKRPSVVANDAVRVEPVVPELSGAESAESSGGDRPAGEVTVQPPLSVPVVEIADIRPATEVVRAVRKCALCFESLLGRACFLW